MQMQKSPISLLAGFFSGTTLVPNSLLPAWRGLHPGLPIWRRLFAFAVLGLSISILPGCANFEAASKFGSQTTKLTTLVKAEFTQLETLCSKQAETAIVVANRSDEVPLDDCKHYKAAQGRLADVTVAVLDGYGKALSGLADDKSFDLSSDVKNIGTKLQGLKDKDGQALVNAKEVGALTKLADLLVDVAVYAKRSAAIERMVQETPNLKVTGELLKSFFVASADAPYGRANAPYTNFVSIIDGGSISTERLLAGPAMRTAEPIRTAELLREIRARKQVLQARRNTGPQSVPAKIAAAIDSWQEAVDAFSTDALKPEPAALYARLKALHEKASAAKDAIEGKSE